MIIAIIVDYCDNCRLLQLLQIIATIPIIPIFAVISHHSVETYAFSSQTSFNCVANDMPYVFVLPTDADGL